MFTVLSDYALWKTNAAGYYLTNTLFYSVNVLVFYAIVLQLTESWGTWRSRLAAISAAALFASNPLHCEDVSWIAGRPDVVSGAFYLSSFLLFLRFRKSGKKLTFALSLLTFWLALMAKEASVALPVVLATLCFLWPDVAPNAVTGTAKSEESAEKATEHADESVGSDESSEGDGGTSKKKRKGKRSKNRIAEKKVTSDVALKQPDVAPVAASVEASKSMKERFLLAVQLTWMFWVLDVIYLCIRTNALGTFVGGYTGALGGALDQWVFLRWLELPTYYHIVFPFTKAAFSEGDPFCLYAYGAYAALFICCAMRLCSNRLSWRWAVFLAIWAVSGIVPLFKLWGVGANLEGSRLVFFFTMPLSMVCPVLLLQPSLGPGRFLKLTEEVQDRLIPVGCLGLGAMVVLYVAATYVTNSFWIGAGEESRAIQSQCFEIAKSLKGEERALILGIPKLNGGAHVIFNGTTLEELLSPPFIDVSVFPKFHSFEPFSVGPAETVNATRLKDLLKVSTTKGPFVWNREDRKFRLCPVLQPTSMDLKPIALSAEKVPMEHISKLLPINDPSINGVVPMRRIEARRRPSKDASESGTSEQNSPAQSTANFLASEAPVLRPFGNRVAAKIEGHEVVLQGVTPSDGFIIQQLNIDPLLADFLEFDLKCEPFDMVVPLFVNWHGVSADIQDENQVMFGFSPSRDKSVHKMRVRLSHYWRWLTGGKIDAIIVRLFSSNTVAISNVRLVQENELVPKIELVGEKQSPNGEYFVKPKNLLFRFDNRGVKGGVKTEIEITKDNYFFDNFLFGSNVSEIGRRLSAPQVKGVGQLDSSMFPKKAYYEIRSRMIGADNYFVGEYSDPVTIFMQEAQKQK